MTQPISPDDILEFWYSPAMRRRWFDATPELDDDIRARFETLWRLAAGGKLEHWCDSAEGCLALVIVLDQLPLNMFRGQAKSFATEARAIAACKVALSRGYDQEIGLDRRAFLYMPLMHSENLADQELSVQLFQQSDLEGNLRWARHHRELIRKYGRFPHRNAILGRKSTPAEIAYLASKEAFLG